MQHSKLLHTCALLLVGVACRPTSDDVISFTDHQNATHELTRRMTLSETEELIFGRLSALLVASDGTVLVADQQLFTIHQFDTDGAYTGNIGQEGRGPGEFDHEGTVHKAEWNERLSLSRFSFDGDSLGGFARNVEIRKVDLAHLARITSGTDTEYYKTVVDEVPDTYPTFVRFKVSEKGNYWVDMGELTEGVQLWLVFNPSGNILASYHLPGTTRIQAFQNGMMYTFESAEDGTQSVGVYDSDF